MTDSEIKELINPDRVPKESNQPLPDLEYTHKELKKKHVTLRLLWEEYIDIHPNGYCYGHFKKIYARWKKSKNLSMRQTHKAGDKLFVDYAGDTVNVQDPETGEIKMAQIFVAVMGASDFTYADATESQNLPNWIASHQRCFKYLGAVPHLIVPDNLKSGVKSPCYYDPDINPTYLEMARHYDTAILPARVRKPKDKAKAENGVLHAERRILAALRNRTFFSLSELNNAISELLLKLNQAPFQKLDGTRTEWFQSIDVPEMKPLPKDGYSISNWKRPTVNIDYHVEVEKHYYSVPYRLVGKEVQVRYTNSTVEVFHNNKRVASHLANRKQGGHSTEPEHMPSYHRKYAEWTPSRIINWAKGIGESVGVIAEQIIRSKDHPEQGFRSALGLIRLEKVYNKTRLINACKRALHYQLTGYRSVKSILENRLDELALPQTKDHPPVLHNNVRGYQYYQ